MVVSRSTTPAHTPVLHTHMAIADEKVRIGSGEIEWDLTHGMRCIDERQDAIFTCELYELLPRYDYSR